VHRVEDSNNQKLFGSCRKECEQGSFERLEFASKSSGGIALWNTSKEEEIETLQRETKIIV
jgi:hypothetical protein